ncbi:hypothetical protein Forpe1208_v010296 [Fusarium oxysporum f. sp. rapae]|uniref:Uncharacterized protein n=1 Tax=Fusarium oxysporum f. sp. rapae TaxID=485398 RepID=A0A8J5NZD2_FUSOX|nr:hypothetical protein Forpe1208_v010296 [Fusarium oxysporum f. sp. rapae]
MSSLLQFYHCKSVVVIIGKGIGKRFSHWACAPDRGNWIICVVTAQANDCDGRTVGRSKMAGVAFYFPCSICYGT